MTNTMYVSSSTIISLGSCATSKLLPIVFFLNLFIYTGESHPPRGVFMCPSVNCNLTDPRGEISTFGSGSFIVVLSPNIHPRWQSSANSLTRVKGQSHSGSVPLNSNRSSPPPPRIPRSAPASLPIPYLKRAAGGCRRFIVPT